MWTPSFPKSDKPLYLALADEIEMAIQLNVLKPEERLPTQREVAIQLGITVGTVNRAYVQARRRGWIVTRVGSGSYVNSRVSRQKSGRITDEMRRSVGLSLGRLAVNPSLVDELVEARSFSQSPVEEAGRRWLHEAGVDVPLTAVITFAGAQHALSAVLAGVVGRGQDIICEELTFPGIAALASVMGINLRPALTDEEGLIPASVDALCQTYRPRILYTVPSLQIPTLVTMGETRRRELVSVARKHDLLIIEDDPHSRIVDGPLTPLATLAPERTIYVSDVSNALCPALRCAFLAAPPQCVAEIHRGRKAMLIAVPGIEPRLIADWILEDGGATLLSSRRADLRKRHAIATSVLAGFKLSSHPASSLVWLELPAGFHSSSVAEFGVGLGLEIQPIEAFAIDKVSKPPGVLISLASKSSEQDLTAALVELARYLSCRAVDMPTFEFT